MRKAESKVTNPDSARLTREEAEAIQLKQALKAKRLRPLPSEPMQPGNAKSDVKKGLFSHRSVESLIERKLGKDVDSLPAHIRKKLPPSSRFTVYKSKTNKNIAYVEARPKNGGASKWFVLEARPTVSGAGAGGNAAPGDKRARISSKLAAILRTHKIALPQGGKNQEFWKDIEAAAEKPVDKKNGSKGSVLHSLSLQMAAAMIGDKPGMTPEQINAMAAKIEENLRAEAHRNLHENYPSWDALNNAVIDAVNKSHLSTPGRATRLADPEFKAEAERLARPWQNDTKIAVLGRNKNGEAFQLRLAMIRDAMSRIDVAVWKIYGDECGEAFVSALVEKRRRNPEIPIHVIVDGNVALRDEKSMALLERLRDAGADVMPWHQEEHPVDGMHWKAMVVDAGTPHPKAIVGGRNIGSEYCLDGRWRDTEILYEGRAALSTYREFATLWNKVARTPIWQPSLEEIRDMDMDPALKDAEASVMPVMDLPGPDDAQAIAKMVVKAIQGAEREINIEQGYFLEIPAILKGLEESARRGVKVRIFSNGDEAIDVSGLNVMVKSALAKMAELPEAEIYTKKSARNPKTGIPLNTLHSKFFTVDGRFGGVGSWNQQPRSMILEAEGMTFFFEGNAVAALNADFENDLLLDSHRETPASLQLTEGDRKTLDLLQSAGLPHL